jgi:hypothetical protein
MDLDVSRFNLSGESEPTASVHELLSPSKEAYKKRLAENLLSSDARESKILAFKAKARFCAGSRALRSSGHSPAPPRPCRLPRRPWTSTTA